jgi:phospholipase/carboxylesterase
MNQSPPVEIQPFADASACVIWLHGLGADGHDFEPVVSELELPDTLHIRFVFPHAPKRPVTINGGMVMRAWYDIAPAPGGFSDNEADITRSVSLVSGMIAHEIDRGISADRIVLAGFSQGGAIALAAGLTWSEPLAGIIVLSSYLPMADSADQWIDPASSSVPIFQAHGSRDPLIEMARGKASCALLRQLGYSVEWHQYPIEHSVCAEEIDDLSGWLLRALDSADA